MKHPAFATPLRCISLRTRYRSDPKSPLDSAWGRLIEIGQENILGTIRCRRNGIPVRREPRKPHAVSQTQDRGTAVFRTDGGRPVDGTAERFIGPNGSGKTNFLEAIALFRACTHGLGRVFEADGIGEWLWKGPRAGNSFTLDADVEHGRGTKARHLMKVAIRNGKPIMEAEKRKN